jgi:hypothetical protein
METYSVVVLSKTEKETFRSKPSTLEKCLAFSKKLKTKAKGYNNKVCYVETTQSVKHLTICRSDFLFQFVGD